MALNIKTMVAAILTIFIAIIVIFVVILISAVWLKGFGLLTNTLTTLPNQINTSNVSDYSTTTFGNLNSGFSQLRGISLVIIFSIVVGLFIAFVTIKSTPMLFGIWIFLMVPAMVFSIIISVAYNNLLSSGIGSDLKAFTGSSNIIANLPIWIAVIGLIGAVLIFVKFKTTEDETI